MSLNSPDPAPVPGPCEVRGLSGEQVSVPACDDPMDRAFEALMWRMYRPEWTQVGWWEAELRPRVRDLLWLPVGWELQQRLEDVWAGDRASDYPPGECPHPHTIATLSEPVGVPGRPCACQVVLVAAWNAVASWVTHRAEQELVAVAGAEPVEEHIAPDRPDLGTLTDPAIEELAPALRVSPGGARYRLAGLRRITSVPRLADAVAEGSVIGWHAHLVATDLRHLPEADQDEVVGILLDRLQQRRERGLREWTSSDLRVQAKRIAARLDFDLAARRQACHRNRGVRLRLHGHGAATITADLADDVGSRIFHRITAIAHGLDSESDDHGPGGEGRRTLDQRRGDVFTDLLLASPGAPPSQSPAAGAPSVPATVAGSEVGVVIDLATLLHLADNPGEMPGLGPIPADIARDLAADARWRAWITTTTSAGTQVVATSPGTYRPTAALARLIRAREPECRMPGCQSRITDLDHVVPFPRGSTTAANLGPLCRRHHRLKTHTRWRQHVHEAGDDDSASATGADAPPMSTWTSPAGITHTDSPEAPLS